MIDSTEYYEVYNQTGDILQNVQPIITTSDYVTSFFLLVFIFFLYKKHFKKKMFV